MKGKDLQHGIIDLARTLGWRVAHFPPVKTQHGWRVPVAADGKGWPDLFLVRERALVVEVKGAGDTLKPEQETWLTAFRLAGIEAHVWRPADWGPDGVIETTLKLRRRRDAPQGPSPEWARALTAEEREALIASWTEPIVR